jgi:hypothetical protein
MEPIMETARGNVISWRAKPAPQFSYPHQLVRDPDIGLDQKRAILAAWASDEHAVESFPTLRHLPGTPFPVTFSSIMDARAELDRIFDPDNDDNPPPRRPGMIRRLGASDLKAVA